MSIENPVSIVTSNIGTGSMAVYFSPSNPSIIIKEDDTLVPAGTSLNITANRITTNVTTTLTSSTAYISAIAIITDAAGTGSTVTVQDKSATPLKLIDGLITTSVTTTPLNDNYQTPLKMNGGIDIVTAGVAAAAINIWINYYQ